MAIVSVEKAIQDCQTYLHDRSGLTWSEDELYQWYDEGIRALLSTTHLVKHWTIHALPPRYTIACTYQWEKRFALGGTARLFPFVGPSGRSATSLWEIPQFEQLDGDAGHSTVTQLWELSYTRRSSDTSYRIALPKDHERLYGTWWDHKRLEPVGVFELDRLSDAWHMRQGEPWLITEGTGSRNTYEIYQIQVNPEGQQYAYETWEDAGTPRFIDGARSWVPGTADGDWVFAYTTPGEFVDGLAGVGLRITGGQTSRRFFCTYRWEEALQAGVPVVEVPPSGRIGTYSWEIRHGATNVAPCPVGGIRGLESTERQYVQAAMWDTGLGLIREWHSSEQSLLLWEAVTHATALVPGDTLPFLPPQMHKYVRAYVLAKAFGHQGEGYMPDLSAAWERFWQRGLQFAASLGNMLWIDQPMRRDPNRQSVERRPRLQLPAEYPRVPWLG